MMTNRTIEFLHRSYPIRGVFRISRGSKTQSDAVLVRVAENHAFGWGECIPYAHYGENVASVIEQIRVIAPLVRSGLSREDLQGRMPAGAARNAVDCALWDLESRLSDIPIYQTAGLRGPVLPVQTAFTLSLDTPDRMGAMARARPEMPFLKLKLGGDGDVERVEAVRAAAPSARLMADANESWRPEHLTRFLPEFARLGVELLEQPLPAGKDDFLEGFRSPIPLAADESCRDRRSIVDIRSKYAFANIKLDKAGGLTEALALARMARAAGMNVMVGCMVASSLSMAPALVLAQLADVVHLDGPLLLAADWDASLPIDRATLAPSAAVWSL